MFVTSEKQYFMLSSLPFEKKEQKNFFYLQTRNKKNPIFLFLNFQNSSNVMAKEKLRKFSRDYLSSMHF